jgi:anti-sigma regulatory factor (Ser/Thr protein kinase)
VGEVDRLTLELPAEPATLAQLRRALGRFLDRAGADAEDVFALTIAVGEAAANAVEHAYGPGHATFTVDVELRGDEVLVTVRDAGRWRAPRAAGRGRGLRLMEALADSVEIEHGEDGTAVHVARRLRRGSAHPAD